MLFYHKRRCMQGSSIEIVTAHSHRQSWTMGYIHECYRNDCSVNGSLTVFLFYLNMVNFSILKLLKSGINAVSIACKNSIQYYSVQLKLLLSCLRYQASHTMLGLLYTFWIHQCYLLWSHLIQTELILDICKRHLLYRRARFIMYSFHEKGVVSYFIGTHTVLQM